MAPSFLRIIQQQNFLFWVNFGLIDQDSDCPISFHICVDWYLAEFLPYVLAAQMLGTKTI